MLNKLIKNDVNDRVSLFLNQHGVVHVGFIDEDVAKKTFSSDKNFDWTKFKAEDDSLLYSDLIVQLINMTPGELEIVDLGAGSSVPTIRSIIQTDSRDRVNVIAVDNSSSAIHISRDNVNKLGLNNNYTFIKKDMFDFISGYDFKSNTVIVTNPPYLPFPEGSKSEVYETVNGGLDGSKYLEAVLLNPEIPFGAIIALQWSSLSNPIKIIDIIEKQYEVIFINAFRTPFGTYTGTIKEYLLEQRRKGVSVFTDEHDGTHQYLFLSTILKKQLLI